MKVKYKILDLDFVYRFGKMSSENEFGKCARTPNYYTTRQYKAAIFSKLANDQGERTIFHCIGVGRITRPGYHVYILW